MSVQTTSVAPEDRDLGHTPEGVEPTERSSLRRGRFSTGLEQLPGSPRKLHVGRFSEGIERLPDVSGPSQVGRFSEGIEQLPETETNLRTGTFADGLREVRRGRRSTQSPRRLRPAA